MNERPQPLGAPPASGTAPGNPWRAEFLTTFTLALPIVLTQLAQVGIGATDTIFMGRLGTEELAASSVILNLILICVLPGLGLGLAGASLVGQALGAGDAADARRWGWEVLGVGVVATGGLGLLLAAGAPTWLGVFMPDAPHTVAMAVGPLVLIGLTQWIEPVVLNNILLGVGDTMAVLVISLVTQWLIFLPTAYVTSVTLEGGLIALWGSMVLYRALALSGVLLRFHRGAWARVAV